MRHLNPVVSFLIICLEIGMFAQSLAACASEKEVGKKNVVLYVTLTTGNPFYEEMIDGLKTGIEAEKEWELHVQTGATPDDASGQSQIMESYLNKSQLSKDINLIGVILVPANSSTALTMAIRAYNQAGVPVINVDIPIDKSALVSSGAKIDAFIGSNNVDGAKKAGVEMASRLPSGGNILLLLGVPGQANTRDRKVGFMDGLMGTAKVGGAKYSVAEWTANWNRSEALTTVEAILSSKKRINGIFAENDLMALGAVGSKTLQAMDASSRPIVIGYDAVPEAKKAVQEGDLYATVSQNPFKMGVNAIEALSKIKQGKYVQGRTEIETVLIMKEIAGERK